MLLTKALKLDLRQAEVDFVIPNIEKDLNLYVDPLLFYNSRSESFQAVHSVLHEFFSVAIDQVRAGNFNVAERMLSFPEVHEIMLGQSKSSHTGRGMGSKRGKIIFDEIVANADVQERGITHLAEMQLLIEGVGFDLISDMCANIIKPFLVDYTQRQCRMHGIPLEEGLCLEHVFDWDELCWEDIHVALPVNPISGHPILLVPKSVVRRFPIFDYKDFWQSTYRYMLRDVEQERSLQAIGKQPRVTWKDINAKYAFNKKTVVQALHERPALRHKYVDGLERRVKVVAVPTDLFWVKGADRTVRKAKDYAEELSAIRPGREDAKRFEHLVLRILTTLFSPPLTDPKEQVSSHDGRECIDITFYNGANEGFWVDMKQLWRAQVPVFEVKNMADLANEEFFQLAARLDEVKGTFGILVARNKDALDIGRAYRRLNRERKVTLPIIDSDLIEMLEAKDAGNTGTDVLQAKYRAFMDAA